jgi:hypothetical protein
MQLLHAIMLFLHATINKLINIIYFFFAYNNHRLPLLYKREQKIVKYHGNFFKKLSTLVMHLLGPKV